MTCDERELDAGYTKIVRRELLQTNLHTDAFILFMSEAVQDECVQPLTEVPSTSRDVERNHSQASASRDSNQH